MRRDVTDRGPAAEHGQTGARGGAQGRCAQTGNLGRTAGECGTRHSHVVSYARVKCVDCYKTLSVSVTLSGGCVVTGCALYVDDKREMWACFVSGVLCC